MIEEEGEGVERPGRAHPGEFVGAKVHFGLALPTWSAPNRELSHLFFNIHSLTVWILVGLVALQVVLGIMSHSIPFAIVFHVLNAFGIFLMAAYTGYRATRSTDALAAAAAPVSVTA